MYTALRATSLTLANSIRVQLESDPILDRSFSAALGGNMVVSLNTPEEMTAKNVEGLSLWMYRVIRDDQRLNIPPVRKGFNQLGCSPLPLRLHYLIVPVVNTTGTVSGPETAQIILGKVLQIFNDHPILSGTDLQAEFSGTEVELHMRLETLSLDEISRVWEALEGSYQLSVSYEVSTVYIESALEPEKVSPVVVEEPGLGVIV